ncbi:hypothetical protein ACQPVP_16545 [Clostridium nigeriense]|uniref:hypothetical protein n=1 Tax=Clostridium nigeriense TaxID=1805470 RepID=UPI003D346954
MIKKLNFDKCETYDDVNKEIFNKINEIIDVVNNISVNVKVLEANSTHLTGVLSDIISVEKASISDLESSKTCVAGIKTDKYKLDISELISTKEGEISRVTSIEDGIKKESSVLFDTQGNIVLNCKRK